MGYLMNRDTFSKWIETLWQEGEVFGPILMEQKGAFSDTNLTTYGPVKSFDDLVVNAKTYLSPKQYVFPTRETLFHFDEASFKVPELDTKPIYVFLRTCDINGIDRLDTMFLKNGTIVDPYYARRRERMVFIMMDCKDKGFDSCFCVSMESNTTNAWHFSFMSEGDTISVLENQSQDENLTQSIGVAFASNALKQISQNSDLREVPSFVTENETVVTVPILGSIDKSMFDHELWQEYTIRCIACGRCNTSCVTCSCFTMQDVKFGEVFGERRRRWASCHVKEYTDMAGGHSFRKKNGERMRFKTLHKIDDFNKRFGKNMCVGCGRCDDVCPEYISFSKAINKLSQIVKENGGNIDEK